MATTTVPRGAQPMSKVMRTTMRKAFQKDGRPVDTIEQFTQLPILDSKTNTDVVITRERAINGVPLDVCNCAGAQASRAAGWRDAVWFETTQYLLHPSGTYWLRFAGSASGQLATLLRRWDESSTEEMEDTVLTLKAPRSRGLKEKKKQSKVVRDNRAAGREPRKQKTPSLREPLLTRDGRLRGNRMAVNPARAA